MSVQENLCRIIFSVCMILQMISIKALVLEKPSLLQKQKNDLYSKTSEIKSSTSKFQNDVKSLLSLVISSQEVLKGCKVYFVKDVEHLINQPESEYHELFQEISALPKIQSHSSGVVHLKVGENITSIALKRPSKLFSRSCIITIVCIFSDFSLKKESELKEALVMPSLNPPTIRNTDKYIILSTPENLQRFTQSAFIKGIKYKIVLTKKITNSLLKEQLKICRICPHCPRGPVITLDFDVQRNSYDSSELFKDSEANFFGSILKLSTTTKVPQLLELEKKLVLKKNGEMGEEYVPKRGLYNSVLIHLVQSLNFSYEIVPSSGGGSTGHALPNGTWVGIVGDVYSESVDFGFMAAITYHRFPYAEFCSVVNFAFLGFATGPPSKIYTWKAIFWPFDSLTWGATILSLLISTLVAKFLHNFPLRKLFMHKPKENGQRRPINIEENIEWSILEILAYFLRSLVEQCDSLPSKLSISTKLFLIMWLLFALVTTSAYRSKMVSFMTFPVVDKVPTSMDELAASNFEIDFHYFGNVGYTYFRTSTNPSFMKIFGKMGRQPDPVKCLQRTVEEKAACIIFIITFEELKYRNLSNEYGDSPVKFTPHQGAMFPAGVIHSYKAPLSANFKRVVSTAMEMGVVGFWEKSDLKQILRDKNAWERKENKKAWAYIRKWIDESDHTDFLKLKNLKGAYAMLVGGIAISLGRFLWESDVKFFAKRIFIRILHRLF